MKIMPHRNEHEYKYTDYDPAYTFIDVFLKKHVYMYTYTFSLSVSYKICVLFMQK